MRKSSIQRASIIIFALLAQCAVAGPVKTILQVDSDPQMKEIIIPDKQLLQILSFVKSTSGPRATIGISVFYGQDTGTLNQGAGIVLARSTTAFGNTSESSESLALPVIVAGPGVVRIRGGTNAEPAILTFRLLPANATNLR